MFPSFPPPQSRGRARDADPAAGRSYGAVAEPLRLRPATPEGQQSRISIYDGVGYLFVWVMFVVALIPTAIVASATLGYLGLGYSIFASLALIYMSQGSGWRALAICCLLFTGLGFAGGYFINRLCNEDIKSPVYPTEGVTSLAVIISCSIAGGAFFLIPPLLAGLFYSLDLPLTTQPASPSWRKDIADMQLSGMALNDKRHYPRDFVRKMVENRAHYSGEIFLDYIFDVGDTHGWIGLILSHKANPLSRFERIFVLIIEILLAVPPVTFLSVALDNLPSWLVPLITAVAVTVPRNMIKGLLVKASEWDFEIELEAEESANQDTGRLRRALYAELAIFAFFLALGGGVAVFCVWFIQHHSNVGWVTELQHHSDGLGWSFIMQLLIPLVMPGRHKERGTWYLGFFGQWAAERFYDTEYAHPQPTPLRKAGRTRSREPLNV